MTNEGSGGSKGTWIVRPGVPAQTVSTTPPALPSVPPAPEKVLRALQESALFKSFTDTGLSLIGSVAQEKSLPRGTPLFVENMMGEALYVIAAGRLRISVRQADGKEIDLAELGPGDSLGEAAILRVGPRLCSATAISDADVIEIARRDIALLQRSKPQACLKLMMGVVELIGNRAREVSPELRLLAGRGK